MNKAKAIRIMRTVATPGEKSFTAADLAEARKVAGDVQIETPAGRMAAREWSYRAAAELAKLGRYKQAEGGSPENRGLSRPHWNVVGGKRNTSQAQFSDKDTFGFLNGEWIDITDSSNVVEAMYDPDARKLGVGFGKPGKPTTYYYYPNVTDNMAESFAHAPSKGKYVWSVFRDTNWPFEGPTGKREIAIPIRDLGGLDQSRDRFERVRSGGANEENTRPFWKRWLGVQ